MMRYMHGDDSKASLVSVRARLAYCIAALLFIGCMIYLNYKVIHTEGFSLPLLLCTLVLICISSICILRTLWMNWKYSVHAEGITIKTCLTCRSIAWDSICSGRRTPLLTGKHVSKTTFLFFSPKNRLQHSTTFRTLSIVGCTVTGSSLSVTRMSGFRNCKSFAQKSSV